MISFFKSNRMLLWLVVPILILTGCIQDKEAEDWSETVKMFVSSETGEYRGFMSDTIFEGMKIKEEQEKNWSVVPFGTIDEFTYKKGNEYVLKVRKTHLANPPADASSVRYSLIEILSEK